MLFMYLALTLMFEFLVFKHHFIFLMTLNQVLIILDPWIYFRLVH